VRHDHAPRSADQESDERSQQESEMSTASKVLIVVLSVVLGINSHLLYKTHSTATNITTYLGSNNGARTTWSGGVIL
jgi:hypothetical protein